MNKYVQILSKQTEIILKNIEYALAYVSDDLLEKEINGYLLWKHFYHMLNSLDRIFTVPVNYKFPEFHEKGLNSLDVVSGKSLDKNTLVNYFKGIKSGIHTYLDQIDDEKLLEEVILQEMRLTRLDVILAQFRHATWHLGYLHSCLKVETGDMPKYIGVNPEYYPI